MRSGTKGLNEEVLDKKLDDIMFVFRYLEDKDLFNKVRRKILNLFTFLNLDLIYF